MRNDHFYNIKKDCTAIVVGFGKGRDDKVAKMIKLHVGGCPPAWIGQKVRVVDITTLHRAKEKNESIADYHKATMMYDCIAVDPVCESIIEHFGIRPKCKFHALELQRVDEEGKCINYGEEDDV